MPLILPKNNWYSKPTISPNCVDAMFMNFRSSATNIADGVLTNTLVYLYPFRLSVEFPITFFWWVNGTTANGNVAAGVYSLDGQTLLSTTGSVAQSGTSTLQTQAPSATSILPPGRYYMALATSSTTSTFARNVNSAASSSAAGWRMHTTTAGNNVPLPSALTFATITRTENPYYGITRLAVI